MGELIAGGAVALGASAIMFLLNTRAENERRKADRKHSDALRQLDLEREDATRFHDQRRQVYAAFLAAADELVAVALMDSPSEKARVDLCEMAVGRLRRAEQVAALVAGKMVRGLLDDHRAIALAHTHQVLLVDRESGAEPWSISRTVIADAMRKELGVDDEGLDATLDALPDGWRDRIDEFLGAWRDRAIGGIDNGEARDPS